MSEMQHWQDTICLLAGAPMALRKKQTLRRETQEIETPLVTNPRPDTLWSRLGKWRRWTITYPGSYIPRKTDAD